MDKQLIDAFTKATQEVFAMMAGIEVGENKIVKDKQQKIYGDVSGVIGFTDKFSENINGSIVLALPLSLAKKAVANMLAIDESELEEEDIQDGIGELVNMIAGDAKSKCNNAFKISLPTVITGLHHSIGKIKEEIVIIKFKNNEETFYLQISLEEK
ncbi:MAG: chemotaxis protein CheX [Candidatus Desulfofervidus auxilii]|nr:chemotaxis protein CheX [Candidatus Desulfofervidus auxilii]